MTSRFFTTLAWAVIVCTIVVLPLAVSYGGKDDFRPPKDAVFIATAVILGWLSLGAFLFGERIAMRHSRPLQVSAAAVAWVSLCAAEASNRAISSRSLFWFLCIIVFGMVTYVLGRSRPMSVMYWLAIPAIINAVFFLLQRTGVWNPIVFAADIPEHFRYTALIGNPNDAGSFFVAPAITFAALAIVDERRRTRWSITTLIVALALFGGSLTSQAAFVAGLLALAFVRRRRVVMIATAIVLTAATASAIVIPTLNVRIRHVVTAFIAGDYAEALSGRVTPFLAAARMIRDHPGLGVGPGCFAWEYFPYKLEIERDHPRLIGAFAHSFNFGQVHNDHLQFLAETGAPGYALFIAALFLLIRTSLRETPTERSPRQELARILSLPLAVSLFVLCLAHFPLQLAAPTLMFLFVGALCVAWSESDEDAVRGTPARPSKPSDVPLRAIAAFIAIIPAGLLIQKKVVMPWRCNLIEKRLETRTIAASGRESFRSWIIARQNLDELVPCLSAEPNDVDWYMIAAANQRILGRLSDAESSYKAALEYDRRPEIYYNLGLVQLDLNRHSEAIDNLRRAVLFNRELIREIPYPDVRNELYAIFARDYPYFSTPPV